MRLVGRLDLTEPIKELIFAPFIAAPLSVISVGIISGNLTLSSFFIWSFFMLVLGVIANCTFVYLFLILRKYIPLIGNLFTSLACGMFFAALIAAYLSPDIYPGFSELHETHVRLSMLNNMLLAMIFSFFDILIIWRFRVNID